ncbi:rec14 [Candida margitis]|uniref:rec14 n=1 Tax=Candida margitis TaxID=1775924 RepID=UPI002227D41F|nr:rec14 [Candida margitis]KAI5961066.1 rec14 [Candida margitis]
MGKQYISTVSASQAHNSDILGVEITPRYTISVSSDGYARFWDNKKDEVHDPKEFVQSVFIDKSGIHHLAVYENKIPSSTIKVTVLSFACFNGQVKFKQFINDDLTTLEDCVFKLSKSWVPGFYVDPESKQDYFIVNKMNGVTEVYTVSITANADKVSSAFTKYGDLRNGTSSNSSTSSTSSSPFAISLAVNQTDNKKCAVGYINGDVLLYDFQNLKVVYTFRSTDLVVSRNPKLNSSSSIPRAIAFSPGGTLLAVARDNQAAGSITLYDVQYGENVGTLATPSHSAKSVVGGFAHQGWILGIDFDEEGKNLVSCGFDKCVRVWNLETSEREATINISITDLDGASNDDQQDESVASGVKFISKGVRGGAGGDSNEGICVVSFDRGIRWYREAGGI